MCAMLHVRDPGKRKSGNESDQPPPLIEYEACFQRSQSPGSGEQVRDDGLAPSSSSDIDDGTPFRNWQSSYSSDYCWACADASDAQYPIADHSLACQKKMGESSSSSATKKQRTVSPSLSMDDTIELMAKIYPSLNVAESVKKRYHLHEQILLLLGLTKRNLGETRLLDGIAAVRFKVDADTYPTAHFPVTIFDEDAENEYFDLLVRLDCEELKK